MSSTTDPLQIQVPRSLTALLQLLQLLVGREGHRRWCGGVVPREKLEGFVVKMSARYPVARNARGRAYDRKRGLAVVHLVCYPVDEGVAWWLLSSEGKGGLADPGAPDAHVARDAMSAQHHIEFGDYVLLYATKRAPRRVLDKKAGKERTVASSLSTWTWKLRASVVKELKASIETECRTLQYGEDVGKGWGLRGLLGRQRRRPLFSGVRNQVIELHRFARDSWARYRTTWLSQHARFIKRYGDKAGSLMPMNEMMSRHLPTMPRLKVYDDPPVRLVDLCGAPEIVPRAETGAVCRTDEPACT